MTDTSTEPEAVTEADAVEQQPADETAQQPATAPQPVEAETPPPASTAPIPNSALFKTAAIVQRDTWFHERVMAACWALGVEYSVAVLRKVAADKAVTDATVVDALGTVDTFGVTDEVIMAAVTAATGGAGGGV
jgi:hypothetical protein